MVVRITEIDPICAMQACMDGYEVVSPYLDGKNDGTEESINKTLLQDTDLIVTSTGNYKVCDKHMLGNLKACLKVAEHVFITNFIISSGSYYEIGIL